MRVRMKAKISGTRCGVEWPEVGGELDVFDDEGASLCANGLADPVAAAVESASLSTAEAATLPKPRSRTKRA